MMKSMDSDLYTVRHYGIKPKDDKIVEISEKMQIPHRMMKALLELLYVGTSERLHADEGVYMGCQIVDDLIARQDTFGFLEAVTQLVTSFKDMILDRHRLKDPSLLWGIGHQDHVFLYIEQILIALSMSGVISIHHARRLSDQDCEYLDELLSRYGLLQ